MKRIPSFVLMLLAAVLVIQACKKADDGKGSTGGDVVNGFDKTAMLRFYADSLIIPGYARLSQDLSELNGSAAAFLSAPSASTQDATRGAYEKAYRSYQRVAAFQFGPADNALLDLFLNFSGGLDYSFTTAGSLTGFSVDVARIDSFVNTGSLPAHTEINRGSFYLQGFGALGYLLYAPNAIAELQKPAAASRAAYTKAVLTRMKQLVQTVLDTWTNTYRGEFIANTKTNVGSPIGNMVNQFAYQLDLMKGPRIGWPFGKQSNGIVFATKTEAYYAGISMALAVENLRALRNSYTGGPSGKGLAGYLIALEQEPLSNDVIAQFDVAIAKLETIPDPLATSLTTHAPAVDAAYKEVQKLLTLLKTDVASATAVQITFMDNDGD